MTDNEIVKALECCISGYCIADVCPLYDEADGDDIGTCTSKLSEHSLDLINRQKAEIERLQKELPENKYGNRVRVKNGLICTNTLDDYDRLIGDISSEAIKEFAERFLEIVHNNHYLLRTNLNSTDYGMFTLGIEQALNEAKEMVGERE